MNFGFLNLITIIFVIGKLLGAFKFSWLIVFLPTIISIVMILICFFVVAIVALIGVLNGDN
jgi:hypothetical protein